MTPTQDTNRFVSSRSQRISCVISIFLFIGLLLSPPSSAGYEQIEDFNTVAPGGMAVNVSGTGGVPAGSVYTNGVADLGGFSSGISRYTPTGEFREAWGLGVGDGTAVLQRCGPDGDPSFPSCKLGIIDEKVGGWEGAREIAIDQSTGYVYVLTGRDHGAVQVFSADGSQAIAAFGEVSASNGETVSESPEKLHNDNRGIAVDSSGTVYVSDIADNSNGGDRAMVFEPEGPGDYEHYVYAGQAHDVGASTRPEELAVDDAGNLYMTRKGQTEIAKYAPDNPTVPICKYEAPSGGVKGMAVNQIRGEVFYFTNKDKKIHQLSGCEAPGEFKEIGVIPVAPKPDEIAVLVLNPILSWEGTRPAGVLYAVDPKSDPQATPPRLPRTHIFAPAEIHFPEVESESVSSVTSTTASLGAQMNPKGSATRYTFQYITKAAYEANEPGNRFAGAIEAPLGGGLLGAGQEALSASASLVGLEPDTEYHYRVIATSHCEPEHEEEVCEDIGADQSFRTFPLEAAALPDSRAWELVSPAQKYGGEVFPANPAVGRCGGECKPGTFAHLFPLQSSSDGEAVVYEGFPFSFTEGAAVYNQYLSKRTASGWQTKPLAPVLMGSGFLEGYKAFDAELTKGILYQTDPSLNPDAPSEYANLYAQPTASPLSLAPLVTVQPPNRQPGHKAGAFQLTYASASADFSHVIFEADDALTEETPFAPEAVDGGAGAYNLYESVGGQLALVNVLPGNAETVQGAVFGSGRQLEKSFNPPADLTHAISADGSRVFWSDKAGQAYVREGGESTTAIPDPGKFLSASADGSEVLLSNGHLYDLETEAITDLTEGKGGFQGILGQGDDLSHVYFVDTAVLTGEEENEEGAKAQEGQNNLYAWHDGESSFVATLSDRDNQTRGEGTGDWLASLSKRSAEASPNGRWVAFLAEVPLTGYDSFGPACEMNSVQEYVSALCFEAFLYDSGTGKLICASCNPSGARPLGRTTLPIVQNAEGSLPQPHYLTDSGRLYFDTQDSLVPFDTNDGVEDVYQYEPQGVGSCKREGGCTALISAGHEPVDSNFLAADATGKNVFFTSRDQLLLKDRDDLVDLYVAREGGGIGAETETARGECQGEACQAAISPPNDPTPGSSTFEGAGNVDEKKAAKKHKHKKKHKHAKKHKSHKRFHGQAANNNRGGAK